MKRLLQAPNLALATLWADQLACAGIAANVQRAYASSIAGEIPPDQALPEIWVPTTPTTPRARALLDELQPPAAPPLAVPRLRRSRRRAVRAVLELRRDALSAARRRRACIMPDHDPHLRATASMTSQLPGIQPEIAVAGDAPTTNGVLGAAGAPASGSAPLLLNTVHRQLVQPRLRRAQVGRAVAPHPSELGHRLRDPAAPGATWSTTGSRREGSFVYEPPGEIHTLVVDELVGAAEMITFFIIARRA